MHQSAGPDWHVVVPVKGGAAAKSRLRSSLDDGDLVRAITHDTLDVAAATLGAHRVIVVTSDRDESAHARDLGYAVVSDAGGGLDAACRQGVEAARFSGATHVAILLGDHPALTTGELRSALEAGASLDGFFVPDADGLGTALVGFGPRATTTTAFGSGSAARHEAIGLTRLELALPGLRHDVDDARSLAHAIDTLPLGPRTRAALTR